MQDGRQSWAAAWGRRFERILDRVFVRAVLSVLIILSLLPVDWVDDASWLFFAVFAVEFVARGFVVWGIPDEVHFDAAVGEEAAEEGVGDPRRSRVGGIVMLLIDLVALVSFLPLEKALGAARWLRVFRLTRMALLAGYWAPLVRDVWALLSRGERARQLMLMAFVVWGMAFAGALWLEYLGEEGAIDFDGDGVAGISEDTTGRGRRFLVKLWWAFRQVEDPGNLLAEPTAAHAAVISLLLTLAGFFLVSFLIGLGTDVVRELLELSRIRAPGLRNHTVIVNITPSTRRLLLELLWYYRKLLPRGARFPSLAWWNHLHHNLSRGQQYLVVGRNAQPPEFLRQPELSRIVYRQRSDEEDAFLARIDAKHARRFVLLADLEDADPDAETIHTLLTIVERLKQRRRAGLLDVPKEHLLIAEILDESNMAAARAAAAATGELRAFAVPTEKLMALFFAIVLRRPGITPLLEELLTSHGHELYTCFFRLPGLSYEREPVSSGSDPALTMEHLVELGLSSPRRARVVPIGVLSPPGKGTTDFEVLINPREGDVQLPAIDDGLGGIVGIAGNFAAIRGFAEDLPADLATAPKPAAVSTEVREVAQRMVPAETTPARRVLVCGFRPGTVYMLEALLNTADGAELLILVENERQRLRVLAALTTHSELVQKSMLPAHHGVFMRRPDGKIGYQPPQSDGGAASTVTVAVADWVASRWLVDLPEGFGHVAALDSVVFVASRGMDSDARTATAMLKLDRMFRQHCDGAGPRVLAEVLDSRLAQRLESRFRDSPANVKVFSIQELRAFFLFQSMVVPGFDLVYAELLGSWGQSFVRLVTDPTASPRGPCSFTALARALARRGMILVAVELGSTDKLRVHVAPGDQQDGGQFDLAELCGVWAITHDDVDRRQARPASIAPPSTSRSTAAAPAE